jgi:hypothetical protein
MSNLAIGSAAVSDFTNKVANYSVNTVTLDSATGERETTYQNGLWTQYLAYYKKIPELKKAIDAFAIWVTGKGYDTDARTKVILDNIKGWGEDTFESILFNMLVTKKINGDSFAEIIRDPDTEEIINLKPLDPGSIRIVANDKGIVKRYEQVDKTGAFTIIEFKPDEILHLCNDRIGSEIHGTSVVEACEWVILARNEAMSNWKTVLNRNIHPLKIWHLDTDDTTKIASFVTKVETTVKDKENIFIPGVGQNKNIELEIPAVTLQDPQTWIRYLENFFYQAVGVPKIIIGGSEEFTEASSKIAYLTFEQVYAKEQRELETDIWNQLYLRVKFVKPASLKNEMLQSEEKQPNYAVGIQPSEMQPGRNE